MLKQGIRFARIAQRYREAMLNSDEAALALLERICLFRLGVDCETLAAIFTGPNAEKVSGKALASLDRNQLQKKLDWLVKMRIVEPNRLLTSEGNAQIRYTIHPAVQDGFLIGLSRDVALASHEAIRQRLQVSLGNVPGTNPADPATLDLMEEIVHHALETGNTTAAWSVYQNRLGGCHNLIARLNDFVRASRITESILRSAVGDELSSDVITILRSDYGYSCLELGNIASAAQLLTKGVDDCYKTQNKNLKTLSRNLACALTESGYLKRALETLRNSLPHFRDATVVVQVLLQIAEIETLGGTVQLTITKSDVGRYTDEHLPPAETDSFPLTIRHDSLDMHRYLNEFKGQVQELSSRGIERAELAEARLDLADRLIWHGDFTAAHANVSAAHEWAVARDARRFLCHCALARTRICLSVIARQEAGRDIADLCSAETSVTQGVKIARDCGYGLYHIDLLLERARLHLLRGDAGAALDDIGIALDTGIPANEKTGQVELLAANHEECGYVWAIPAGLQLRAEALLLQAAQTIGSKGLDRDLTQPALTEWQLKLLRLAETKSIRGKLRELCSGEAVESPWLPRLVGRGSPGELQLLEMLRRFELLGYVRKDEEPDPNDWSDWIICWSLTSDGSRLVQRVDALGVDSARVRGLIAKAREYLIESLDRWHDLRDPEPTEGNNFKLDGKEYNYRAAETHQVLVLLAGGILTEYPLPVANTVSTERDREAEDVKPTPKQTRPVEDRLMDSCEIILFAANPAGTGQLALDKEVREIESKIRAAEHRDNLKLISKWAVRPDDLLQALNQHDATIIHFSGHGSAADEIILTGNDGQPKPVSKAAMSALLKTLRGKIRLVILNACFSRPQAEGITEHIDCAIGMNKAIGDEAAIIFAASVYRAIGFGKSVQEAFDQGIAALLLEGIPEQNTPELLCKTGVDPKQVYLLNPR